MALTLPVLRKPSRSASSASTIVADTMRGHRILKIDGYSLTKCIPAGEYLKSCPFTVGGHRWCIHYCPNGNSWEFADCISLFLTLFDQGVPAAKAVKAKFRFRFVGGAGQGMKAMPDMRIFGTQSSWGTTRFIKSEELEKVLKRDSFTIRCDIAVIEFRVVEETEAWATSVPVPPSNLRLHLGDLLLTQKGADMVFQVGDETFPAHRCVLATRSPVFSAMKEGDATAVVRIDDMEPYVFEALLYFVYNDSLPKTKKRKRRVSMSQHLLVTADRYDLERLKLMCEGRLCRYIDAGTMANILTLADQHHCHGLKKACFGFLSSPANLEEAMATDGFDHLSRSCPSLMKELIATLGT
ncbi:hypothetical protein BS78_05G042800 [Paspalum vaginatum]|nr:hypothetical protein BS78_05G042800 [Paspalum vaginatum]